MCPEADGRRRTIRRGPRRTRSSANGSLAARSASRSSSKPGGSSARPMSRRAPLWIGLGLISAGLVAFAIGLLIGPGGPTYPRSGQPARARADDGRRASWHGGGSRLAGLHPRHRRIAAGDQHRGHASSGSSGFAVIRTPMRSMAQGGWVIGLGSISARFPPSFAGSAGSAFTTVSLGLTFRSPPMAVVRTTGRSGQAHAPPVAVQGPFTSVRQSFRANPVPGSRRHAPEQCHGRYPGDPADGRPNHRSRAGWLPGEDRSRAPERVKSQDVV